MHGLTFILVIVGGLNWLLVGLFKWDVGMFFGGQAAMVSRVIYILVGLSALYLIFTHKKTCKVCDSPKMGAPMGGSMGGGAPMGGQM